MKLREHNVTLRGPKVVLRPMTENDWDILLKWNNEPEVLYFAEGDDVVSRSLEEVQAMYRQISQKAFCFLIEIEGRPIGEGWLQHMNLDRILQKHPDEDCRRIDLMIGEKEMWGRGFGTETICSLTEFGFHEEKADLVFGADISDFNTRSLRAFQKTGYRIDAQVLQPAGTKTKFAYDMVKAHGKRTTKVFVADSGIHGQGVFAVGGVRKNDVIVSIDDSREVTEADPLRAGESQDHCDWLGGGGVVLMQSPERYINHSCDPNAYVKTIAGTRHVFALRDLPARTEIVYDYSINGYGDASWECRWGSLRCRKTVYGDFFRLPLSLQSEYLPLLDDWFVEENRDRIDELKRRCTRE